MRTWILIIYEIITTVVMLSVKRSQEEYKAKEALNKSQLF